MKRFQKNTAVILLAFFCILRSAGLCFGGMYADAETQEIAQEMTQEMEESCVTETETAEEQESAAEPEPPAEKTEDAAGDGSPEEEAAPVSEYTGLQKINGVWYYVKDGNIDYGYTGLVKYNGVWFYVNNGRFDQEYEGLVKYNGVWFYVNGGQLDKSYTGLVKYSGAWFYVSGGQIDKSYTGLVKYNGAWFYVSVGQLDKTYTGLVKYNGVWFYVSGGQLDKAYTGLVKYNGVWFYVSGGQLDKAYTGLVKYNGVWFYVSGGQLDKAYTGLVKYNGVWFYVSRGQIDKGYTGLVKYNGAWFYVSGGQINRTYIGLVSYSGAYFYVENGMINRAYSGYADYNGTSVYVQNGMWDGSYHHIAAPSVNGALHVDGSRLVDKNGNPVQLRGVSTHGLAWYPEYVNQELFNQLHGEWGANVVRLALYTAEYGGYCSGGDQEALKNLVRNGVAYAAAADMYVVVDWHMLSDCDPNQNKAEAISFFKQMSAEFSGYNNVLYEICNEPNGYVTWSSIKAYAQEVIPVIRANDPDAVIIVGTPNWSQCVDQAAADPITGGNIMYTLHFYAGTHKESLRNTMTAAINQGLPVFVTEFGICDASGNGAVDIESANAWIQTMDQYGVSYICWNLSNKNESSAIFKSSCTKKAGFAAEDFSEEGRWLLGILSGH